MGGTGRLDCEVAKHMDARRDYRSLWWRTFVRMLVIYLAPVLVLAAIVNLQYHRLATTSHRAHLMAIADTQAGTLELFLRERIANLLNLADDPASRSFAVQTSSDAGLDRLRRESPSFVDLGLFDERGTLVRYSGPHPELIGRSYDQESWFQRLASSQERFVITDMYLGFRGLAHFTIAVRPLDGNGIAALRATLDPAAISRFLRQAQGADDATTLVVNRDGRPQMIDLPSPIRGHAVVLAPPHEPQSGWAMVDEGGLRFGYAYRWLGLTDWALLTVPVDPQRTRSLNDAGLMLGAVSAAFIFAGFSTILIRSRTVVRRLERQDSERARLADELHHAARLASVGELAAGIAHEINNPLAIITEEAGLIRDLLDPKISGSGPTEDLVPHLETIHAAAFRARDITRRLLTFVRKVDVAPVRVDVNRQLEEILGGFLEHEMVTSCIEFSRNYASGLPPVLVDPGQLEQVVVNLVTNAIDAISGGGKIDVATRLEGAEVVITVTDTGCGIPAALLERIFMPFFTTKEVGRGTGLGLSVSYGIVKGMGGRIDVESEVGKGTRFLIRLPAASEQGGADGHDPHT